MAIPPLHADPRVPQRLGGGHSRLGVKYQTPSEKVDECGIITASQRVSDEVPAGRWATVLSPPRSTPSQLDCTVGARSDGAVAWIALNNDSSNQAVIDPPQSPPPPAAATVPCGRLS